MESREKNRAWVLDHSLGFLLNRAARSMRRALDAKLVEHNLTATQYIVLAKLWEGDGISLSELGDRLDFDNPTLTGVIDRMERDGLVRRQRDADDRRVIQVHVTSKGQELRGAIGRIAGRIDDDAWAAFSEAEQKRFLSYLQLVWERLNGKPD